MNKRGTILVWAMALSFFMVVFFVSLDSTFKKYSFFLNFSEDNIVKDLDVEDYIGSWKNNPITYSNYKNYYLSSLDYNGTAFSGFLADNEKTELWISNNGGDLTLSGNLAFGALNYKLIAFNTGGLYTATITSSGALVYSGGLTMTYNSSGSLVAFTGFSLKFTFPMNFNILYLEGSGGLVSYNIVKGNTNILPQKVIYSFKQERFGTKQFLRNIELENFSLKGYPGLNYSGLGLY